MSNWIDATLDVLASDPAEINKIESALQQPCEELIVWMAERWSRDQKELYEELKELVAFKPTRNLGSIDPSFNKARRFENVFADRSMGIVWNHLHFVSRNFPNAVLLLDHHDCDNDYTARTVIREGRQVCHTVDNEEAQCTEWVMPNVFSPYRTEYNLGVEPGTFWGPWLLSLEHAVAKLKERFGTPNAETTCEAALLKWEHKFENAARFMEFDLD